MKTGRKIILIIVGVATLSAWTSQQENSISKAEWLIGTWENKTPRGSIYETWHKESENQYLGKSYMIKEKDTIVFERIQLRQEKGDLYYIPVVNNQNDGKPVKFLATTVSESSLVFENPQHDFPQIISYTKSTSDSLVAEISGTKNGKERKMTFPMKRIR